MAARNLYTLCSPIIKAAGTVELGPIRTSVRDRPTRISRAAFTTSLRRSEATRPVRYGSAKEPPSHLVEDQTRQGRGTTTDRPARASSEKEPEEQKKIAAPKEAEAEAEADTEKKEAPVKEEPEAPPSEEKADPALITKEALKTAATAPDAASADSPTTTARRLETVLNMPPPSEEAEDNRPPHLAPPPYVHHFDTYSLVRSLGQGGFTDDQSTTIMKGVRAILAENMDLARRGLVSKSNVENETYLFRAACSELKTEIENNRKSELDKNRTRRALLQHEVDILNQRMAQESSHLKDDLKGMFDDRKMTTRVEQRNMENRVSFSLIYNLKS